MFGSAVGIQGASVSAGSVRLEVVDANHDGYLDVAVTGPGPGRSCSRITEENCARPRHGAGRGMGGLRIARSH